MAQIAINVATLGAAYALASLGFVLILPGGRTAVRGTRRKSATAGTVYRRGRARGARGRLVIEFGIRVAHNRLSDLPCLGRTIGST